MQDKYKKQIEFLNNVNYLIYYFMKKIFFSILVLSLILVGCAKEEAKEKAGEPQAGLANPASVFCEEHGGELEIREGEEGQYGVCKFSDGTECEEWAFYRGECGPEVNDNADNEGKNNNNQKENNEPSVKKGNEDIKVFGIEENQTISSPITIKGEGVAFENTLVVELRNEERQALVQEPTMIRSGGVGEKGPFEITLNFQFSGTSEGFVAIYEESAKDGSEVNLVEIPVKYATSTPEN